VDHKEERESLSVRKKTSVFISLCILRDLPQQKIPRELCGGGRSPYISMFLRWGQIKKIQKNKKERMEGKKREIFTL
jgi:hypothetical protein